MQRFAWGTKGTENSCPLCWTAPSNLLICNTGVSACLVSLQCFWHLDLQLFHATILICVCMCVFSVQAQPMRRTSLNGRLWSCEYWLLPISDVIMKWSADNWDSALKRTWNTKHSYYNCTYNIIKVLTLIAKGILKYGHLSFAVKPTGNNIAIVSAEVVA